MRISQHTLDVEKANAEIRLMVLRAAEAAGLTSIELLQGLTACQQSVLKYMLRSERHPDDPDKSADVE